MATFIAGRSLCILATFYRLQIYIFEIPFLSFKIFKLPACPRGNRVIRQFLRDSPSYAHRIWYGLIVRSLSRYHKTIQRKCFTNAGDCSDLFTFVSFAERSPHWRKIVLAFPESQLGNFQSKFSPSRSGDRLFSSLKRIKPIVQKKFAKIPSKTMPTILCVVA